jgi:hypothetical protein
LRRFGIRWNMVKQKSVGPMLDVLLFKCSFFWGGKTPWAQRLTNHVSCIFTVIKTKQGVLKPRLTLKNAVSPVSSWRSSRARRTETCASSIKD